MARRCVVHIAWSLSMGGIETMLVNLANVQADSGLSVKIIIINNQIDEQLASRISDKVKVVRLNRNPKSRSPWAIFRLNCELFGADVIHSHSFTLASYILPIFCRKSVLTIHTTEKTPKLTRERLLKYQRVTAISYGVQQMLKEYFDIDSTIIYNGIDCSRIARKTYAEPHSPVKVLQLGRLIRQKGHQTLIDAIAKLPSLSVQLDIIGDGEEADNIKKLIGANGLQESVRMLGKQSQEYVFEHLADYDLLVQPSLVEGFGLTVAEAMTAGLPVMVSDISGLREVVDGGRYGRIFTAEDSDSCAMALKSFIDNPPTQSEVDLAEKFARENFDIRSVAERFINLYNNI